MSLQKERNTHTRRHRTRDKEHHLGRGDTSQCPRYRSIVLSFARARSSFFCASTYVTDGRVVKGKTKTDDKKRLSSTEKEGENDVSSLWTFAHTYVSQKREKAFITPFVRRFVRRSLALFPFFFTSFLFFGSFLSSSSFVDIRTAIFSVYCMPSSSLSLRSEWDGRSKQRTHTHDDGRATLYDDAFVAGIPFIYL